MTTETEPQPTHPPQLRIWPGVVLVFLVLVLRFLVPAIEPEMTVVGVFGILAGGPLIVLWWLFFSRAPWSQRLGMLALIGAAGAATFPLLHESVTTSMGGLLFPVYALPGLAFILVVWAISIRKPDAPRRYVPLIVALFVANASWALVRTGGFDSQLDHDFAWRWYETPEERMLAVEEIPQAPEVETVELPSTPAEWPGFRGPERAGIARGVRLASDWTASAPTLVWRQPIGPGWSSFAVHGERFYTQEQRGDDEVVSCYDLATGEPIWRHGDPIRFWESNAGAGPRATPLLHDGNVFALGATGALNALSAQDGSVVWSRDAQADSGATRPEWGFSGSPLVVGELLVVPTAGALAAYEAATGELRWSGPTSGDGYSSPQLLTLDGVEQVVFLSKDRATGIDAASGAELWAHEWSGDAIVQPAAVGDSDVMISLGDRNGVRRLAITKSDSDWSVEERWTSTRLKPYFNDYVVAGDHAYGFDGGILGCIDLATGERQWKGGRYGRGQILLSATTGLIIVLSETGELALVEATPIEFRELATAPAIEGKTWNHPVLVDDLLLVRNATEMAAFRLPTEDSVD